MLMQTWSDFCFSPSSLSLMLNAFPRCYFSCPYYASWDFPSSELSHFLFLFICMAFFFPVLAFGFIDFVTLLVCGSFYDCLSPNTLWKSYLWYCLSLSLFFLKVLLILLVLVLILYESVIHWVFLFCWFCFWLYRFCTMFVWSFYGLCSISFIFLSGAFSFGVWLFIQ